MPLFADDRELYKYLGRVFDAAVNDPDLSTKAKASGLLARIEYDDPSAVVAVDFTRGEVYYGEEQIPSGFAPNMSLRMPADDGHRFWLGKLNLGMAVARGKVRVKGSVPKMLKLAPLSKPLQAGYARLLSEEGRVDLLEA